MTGVCLARMAHAMSGSEGLEGAGVQECANRLFIMRSDTPYLNLAGADPEPDRTATFYVSAFPAEWKTTHILEGNVSLGCMRMSAGQQCCFIGSVANSNPPPLQRSRRSARCRCGGRMIRSALSSWRTKTRSTPCCPTSMGTSPLLPVYTCGAC